MEQQNKKPWLSKTIWLNILGLVGQFIPGVSACTAAHPEMILSFFTIANIVLRSLTKDKLSIGD